MANRLCLTYVAETWFPREKNSCSLSTVVCSLNQRCFSKQSGDFSIGPKLNTEASMKLSFSKRSGFLAAGCLAGFLAALAYTPILSVFAQQNNQGSNPSLSEIQAQIRNCRKVIPVNRSVEVFDNTDLATKPANRIGTIYVGTPMYLTGVRRQGNPTAVQIYTSNRGLLGVQPVGWVDASKITDTIPCR